MIRLILALAFVALVPVAYKSGVSYARKRNLIHKGYYGSLWVGLLLVIGLLVMKFLLFVGM